MSNRVRNTWRRNIRKVLLIPFAWLYGLVIRTRNGLFDHGILKSVSFDIPLISVGNITVGGTGKTPHVEYLVRLLKDHFQVATLSRGYKRRTRDFRIVSTTSMVSETGDEALQVKRRFPQITVAVDRKRVNGVARLSEQSPPVEVVLLDDAFQHRSIHAGLSILLIDHSRPIHRDCLLPAGMLREQASNHTRASIILITRTPETLTANERREYVNNFGLSPGQHLYFTTMHYGELVPVFPGKDDKRAERIREQAGGILLVSGIANPQALREYARSLHENLAELTFPDHHHYRKKDLEKISARYHQLKTGCGEVLVLTTDKDAVRLKEHEPDPELREAVFSVPIEVHFLNHDKEEFDRQIINYVNSNKRSGLLHQGQDS